MRDQWIGAIVVGAWLTSICVLVFGAQTSMDNSSHRQCATSDSTVTQAVAATCKTGA